jgi:hypothetical protein
VVELGSILGRFRMLDNESKRNNKHPYYLMMLKRLLSETRALVLIVLVFRWSFEIAYNIRCNVEGWDQGH